MTIALHGDLGVTVDGHPADVAFRGRSMHVSTDRPEVIVAEVINAWRQLSGARPIRAALSDLAVVVSSPAGVWATIGDLGAPVRTLRTRYPLRVSTALWRSVGPAEQRRVKVRAALVALAAVVTARILFERKTS